MKEDKPDDIKSKTDTDKKNLVASRNYLKELIYFFINFYSPVNG
jgi:hypothetical protein